MDGELERRAPGPTIGPGASPGVASGRAAARARAARPARLPRPWRTANPSSAAASISRSFRPLPSATMSPTPRRSALARFAAAWSVARDHVDAQGQAHLRPDHLLRDAPVLHGRRERMTQRSPGATRRTRSAPGSRAATPAASARASATRRCACRTGPDCSGERRHRMAFLESFRDRAVFGAEMAEVSHAVAPIILGVSLACIQHPRGRTNAKRPPCAPAPAAVVFP